MISCQDDEIKLGAKLKVKNGAKIFMRHLVNMGEYADLLKFSLNQYLAFCVFLIICEVTYLMADASRASEINLSPKIILSGYLITERKNCGNGEGLIAL